MILGYADKSRLCSACFALFLILSISSSALAVELYQIHLPVEGYRSLVSLTNVTEEAVDVLISFVGRDGVKSLVKIVQPHTTLRIGIGDLLKGKGLIQAKFAAGRLKVIYWGIGENGGVFGLPFVGVSRTRRFVIGRWRRGYLLLADLPTEIGAGSVVAVKLYNRRGELVRSLLKSVPENAVRVIPVEGIGIAMLEVKDGDVICGYRGISERGVIALNGRAEDLIGREVRLMPGPLGEDGELFLANRSRDTAKVEVALEGKRVRKLIPGCGAMLMRLSDYVEAGGAISISVSSNHPLLGYYFLSPSIVIEPIEPPQGGGTAIAVAPPTSRQKARLLLINPTPNPVSIRFGGYGREPVRTVPLKPGSWISKEVSATTAVKADGKIIGLLVGYQGDRPVWAMQIQ
jgi:hypothetical protein